MKQIKSMHFNYRDIAKYWRRGILTGIGIGILDVLTNSSIIVGFMIPIVAYECVILVSYSEKESKAQRRARLLQANILLLIAIIVAAIIVMLNCFFKLV